MLAWLKSLFGAVVKGIGGIVAAGIVAAITSIATALWAWGPEFFRMPHAMPGWAILGSLGVAVLFGLSIVLNVVQWLRRRVSRDSVRAVALGYPASLSWSMGARGDTPLMSVWGDFHITNLTPHNVAVSRTVLVASYRSWYVVPRRRVVEGAGVYEHMAPQRLIEQRLNWMIEPPILPKGAVLRARVGLIDHLGQTNWGERLNWKYLG